MATLQIDDNFNPAMTYKGNAVGGFIYVERANIVRNQWYRLCPHGNNGAKVSGEPKQLNIGELRADVKNTDFDDWKIKILTEGYRQVLYVQSIDNDGNVQLKESPQFYDSLPDSNLLWVLYPDMLFPLILARDQQSTKVDIGIIKDDKYTPPSSEVRHLYTLGSGAAQAHAIELRTTFVDKLFYRITTQSGNIRMFWGQSKIEYG